MDVREAARREHVRRWSRPDWERWLRPGWERHVAPAQHDTMRQEIAERKAALAPPPCARQRLRDEQIALEREQKLDAEDAWQTECIERKFRADVAWLRFRAALAALLDRKAGFDPNQLRDQNGRWATSDGLAPHNHNQPPPEDIPQSGRKNRKTGPGLSN